MIFTPTKSGGRLLSGDTAFGRFRIEFDSAGVLIGYEMELRDQPPPPEDDTACVHRGAVVGERECSTCDGSVKAKIFACAVHGQCTMFKRPVEGVKACRHCGDRKSGVQ